nr:nucleotidyltransferase family protein [Limnothrix sp. PR1529]
MREWADLLIQPAMVKPDANEWLNRGAGITDYIAEPSNHRQDKGMLKQPLKIQIPQQALIAFCQKWQIQEFSFLGSVLRDDFRPDSDIDVMVSFEDSSTWGILELVQMKRELQMLLGRKVDLLTKKSIEQSHSWIRRKEILETAQVAYVTG